MLATRCTTALTSRALAVPTSRPETASGGLRTVPRLRLSRWRLQPTDTSGKIAPSYDRARRCSHLPQSKSVFCSVVGLLGATGRLRLGVDVAGGSGFYGKFGFGISLRGDGSIETDRYLGLGIGVGILGGAAVGIDNAGGTARGYSSTTVSEASGGFGVPVYGPIGFGGSGSIPLSAGADPSLGGGLGVGPKYGLAAGGTDTTTVTNRSAGGC